MNDLIKEAILDAKSIQKVAMETAKDNMFESFLPQIKSMLALKLKEAEDDMNGDGGDEEEYEDEEGIDEQSDSSKIATGDNKVDKADGGDEEDPGKGKLTEGDESDDEEDLDLESIIKELDDAVREVEGSDDDEEDEDEDTEKTDWPPSGEDEEDGEEEGEYDGEEEEEVVDEDAPMAFLRGQLEEYIEEILKNFKANMAPKPGIRESKKAKAPISKESVRLKKELNEAKKTISYLTGKIKDALLINSKLLYTGKIFRTYNLDESAKMAVLESFDEAKNDREVKMLYEGIQRTLKGSKTSRKAIYTEARASKVIASTKPDPSKIIQEDVAITRMKQLAGIIK